MPPYRPGASSPTHRRARSPRLVRRRRPGSPIRQVRSPRPLVSQRRGLMWCCMSRNPSPTEPPPQSLVRPVPRLARPNQPIPTLGYPPPPEPLVRPVPRLARPNQPIPTLGPIPTFEPTFQPQPPHATRVARRLTQPPSPPTGSTSLREYIDSRPPDVFQEFIGEFEKFLVSLKTNPQTDVDSHLDPTKDMVASQGDPTCGVCMSNKVCVVLRPCRHARLCQSCAISVKKCPWCRTEVTSKQTVFL